MRFELAQIGWGVITIRAADRIDEKQIGAAPDQLPDRLVNIETIQLHQYVSTKVKGAVNKRIEGPMAGWLGIKGQAARLAILFHILHIVQKLCEDAMAIGILTLRLVE